MNNTIYQIFIFIHIELYLYLCYFMYKRYRSTCWYFISMFTLIFIPRLFTLDRVYTTMTTELKNYMFTMLIFVVIIICLSLFSMLLKIRKKKNLKLYEFIFNKITNKNLKLYKYISKKIKKRK